MAEDFKHSFKTDRRGELSLLVYNVGFQKCPPGYGWGPGVRDHYLLHYVLSGQGTYETEGRTFVLQSGEAFLARPDVPIFYRADEVNPWEYYWVGFSGPAAPLLLAQTPFTAARPVLRPAAGDHLRQGLLDIYKARGSDYPAAVRMAGISAGRPGAFDGGGSLPGRRGPEPLCPPGRRLSPAQLFPQRGGGGDRPNLRRQPELSVPGLSGGVSLFPQ